MSEYPNKTDRDEQWAFIEQRLQENDISRSKLKQYKDYFENGDFEKHKSLGVLSLMLYSPELSLERWQAIINALDYNNHPDYRGWSTEEFRKDFFISMQKAFLVFIQNYGFDDKDRAWLFTQVYGDVYNPDRLFPLKMPGETSHRRFTFTSDNILHSILLSSACYVAGDYGAKKREWFFYVDQYFYSLLSHCDKRGFQLEGSEVAGIAFEINDCLNEILAVAFGSESNESDEERARLVFARRLVDFVGGYDGDMGEYRLLVEKHKRNA